MKTLILIILVLLVIGLYYYPDATKEIIGMAVSVFEPVKERIVENTTIVHNITQIVQNVTS